MKSNYFILIFLLSVSTLFAQNDTVNSIDANGYNIFRYKNGNIASKGNMVNGKPDGLWMTFYENGTLKSVGKRKNFLLDSTWLFYNDSGKIILEVNYLKNKKQGKRITYRQNEIIEENFESNVKNGITNIYFPNKSIKKSIPFKKGYEDGIAKEYNEEGRIITLYKYKKGYLIDKERINRVDSKKRKNGRWKWFYKNGNVSEEGNFFHGKKDGYFKKYDINGDLKSITKWDKGEEINDVPELIKLDIKKTYYPDGSIHIEESYKNNIPEGIRREYNKQGKVIASYIFKHGKKIAEGIIDDEGIKDGIWKYFYAENSQLKATGEYNKGKKISEWTYYYINGNLEQRGSYNEKGNPDGTWIWYYENGNVLREENYYDGVRNGLLIEYEENGDTITSGNYYDGLKEGTWFYKLGDYSEKGSYSAGKRYGEWLHYDDNNNLIYKGTYIDGNRNGIHYWYRKDGTIKDKESYVMGLKNGKCVKYNSDGTPFIIITYEHGNEVKYDGVDIE